MVKFKKFVLLVSLVAFASSIGASAAFVSHGDAAPPAGVRSAAAPESGSGLFERRRPEGYDEIVGVLLQAHRDGQLSLGEYLLLRYRLRDQANIENLKESLTHAAEVSSVQVPKSSNGKVDWAALLNLFLTQILPILLKLIGGL